MNKPAGWTSFDVVNRLRRVLGWRTVGHAGTLDPPAAGVLIVMCGSAASRSTEFMELPKEYAARIRFGLTTSTDDLAGEVLSERTITGWSREWIDETLRSFVGEIAQVPPAVSAVKAGGQRSYARVRRGESPALQARTVRIYDVTIQSEKCPEIEIVLRCSRGTYVRALARDLGERLGWGGTLAALQRTAVGPYRVETALTIDEIVRRRAEFAGE